VSFFPACVKKSATICSTMGGVLFSCFRKKVCNICTTPQKSELLCLGRLKAGQELTRWVKQKSYLCIQGWWVKKVKNIWMFPKSLALDLNQTSRFDLIQAKLVVLHVCLDIHMSGIHLSRHCFIMFIAPGTLWDHCYSYDLPTKPGSLVSFITVNTVDIIYLGESCHQMLLSF